MLSIRVVNLLSFSFGLMPRRDQYIVDSSVG